AVGHQGGGLLGAGRAGRALAAALVLEEAHQVEPHRLHIVLVGEDDNRVRPHEAAVLFQRAEVERQIRHRGRQNPAGGTAGQIALEAVTLLHAAAILLDQLARADAGGSEPDAPLLPPPPPPPPTQHLALPPPT